MPIQCVIFDFGGVLMQWEPFRLYRRFFQSEAAVEAFLREVNFRDWNEEQDRGRPFAEAVAALSTQFPQYAAQIQAYDELWLETIAGPIQGTVEVLERLYARGVPLYGLSNWSAEKFPLVRARYPFFKRFREIVLSGEVKLLKPDPAIFKLMLRRTGWAAQECLLVDDAPANVQTARRLGMEAIQFQSPEQLVRELRRYGLL